MYKRARVLQLCHFGAVSNVGCIYLADLGRPERIHGVAATGQRGGACVGSFVLSGPRGRLR